MISKEALDIKDKITKDTPGKDIVKTRSEWEEYAKSLTLPNNFEETEEVIEGVNCLWINKPIDNSTKVVFYVHGGGLVSGSLNTHKEFAIRLSNKANLSILLIDYSLAPESKYPVALNELIEVYKKLLETYDSNKIIFAGDSSGAGLALSTILKLKDNNFELPSQFISISGSFDNTFSGSSFNTRYQLDPFTSRDVLIECFEMYSDKENETNPFVSPLYGNLENLPPMLILVGDHEILLSDSISLDVKTRSSNGQSKLVIFDQMWHVWPLFGEFKESNDALEIIKEFTI